MGTATHFVLPETTILVSKLWSNLTLRYGLSPNPPVRMINCAESQTPSTKRGLGRSKWAHLHTSGTFQLFVENPDDLVDVWIENIARYRLAVHIRSGWSVGRERENVRIDSHQATRYSNCWEVDIAMPKIDPQRVPRSEFPLSRLLKISQALL